MLCFDKNYGLKKYKQSFFFNGRKYSREIFEAKFKEIKDFKKTTTTVKYITNSLGFLK